MLAFATWALFRISSVLGSKPVASKTVSVPVPSIYIPTQDEPSPGSAAESRIVKFASSSFSGVLSKTYHMESSPSAIACLVNGRKVRSILTVISMEKILRIV